MEFEFEGKVPISVIILTYNEERNIEACLKSVHVWADEIFIVDSYSTDKTLEIAKKYTDKIYQHPFENYGKQRNWAQKVLSITYDWIFHLDADERVTLELANEIREAIENASDDVNGFLIRKRIIFMGRWIKHGGCYSNYHLRLFRRGKGYCESRKYDQHFICNGKVLKLKYDIIDENKINLTTWTSRHNRWASAEAEEILFRTFQTGKIKGKWGGNPIEKKRWLKNKIYNRTPLFFRVLFYFIYRYFFHFGFLDGKEGVIYHSLQGFWFRFLVDAKICEKEKDAYRLR